jgi:hypothetical protein
LTDRSFGWCWQNFLRHIFPVIIESWNSSFSLRGTLGCAIFEDSNQEREKKFIISVFAGIDQTYSYGCTPNCILNLFMCIYIHYFILADECIGLKDFYFGGIDQNCRFTFWWHRPKNASFFKIACMISLTLQGNSHWDCCALQDQKLVPAN